MACNCENNENCNTENENEKFYTIILRHDESTKWMINNPILALGEYGVEDDTHRLKRGDGITTWENLKYEDFGLLYIVAFENLSGKIEDNKQLKEAFDDINNQIKELKDRLDNKVVQDIDLSNTIEEKTQRFIDVYYNQHTNETLTSVNENIYYINLGKYLGKVTPSKLSIGENTYNKGEISKKLSIGNNGYVEAPIWKLNENNEILIALPYICVDVLPNEITRIEIEDQVINLKVYNEEVNKLTLTEVGIADNRGDSVASINKNGNIITATYSRKDTLFGVKLALNNEEVTNNTTVIFRKDNNDRVGLTVPEDGYTYTVYLTSYANNVVTEAESLTKVYKLAVPGKGVIEITFNCEGVLPQ